MVLTGTLSTKIEDLIVSINFGGHHRPVTFEGQKYISTIDPSLFKRKKCLN